MIRITYPALLLNTALVALSILVACTHPAQAAPTAAQQAKANAALLGLWTTWKVTADQVQATLDAGAVVDVRDNDGRTSLMLASNIGIVDCVKLLLSKGAKVNARGKDGATALMEAALNGHGDCAGILIAAGADVNAQDGAGHTALMLAIHLASQSPDISNAPPGSFDCVKLLASKSADINAKDTFGRNALTYANGQTDIVAVLKEDGAKEPALDQHAKANAALLALWPVDNRGFFAGQKSPVVSAQITLALANGAVVNARDPATGDTALIRASEAGGVACVSYLISKGAGINTTNFDGWTPLSYACFYGNADCVKYLVVKGAHVNFRGGNDQTALEVGAQQLMESSTQADADSEHAVSVVDGQPGIVACMKILLASGVDAASKNSALILAAMGNGTGNTDAVKLLVSKGANVNAKDDDGATPLMAATGMIMPSDIPAAQEGNLPCIAFLISTGADVNVKDKAGHTALSLAHNPHIFAALKAAGAKP